MTPGNVGSLYRGQQLIVFGHYWSAGEAIISITGKVSGQEKTYSTRFDFPEKATLNPEIERLWAFATIEDLQNEIDYLSEDADSEQAIIDIAQEYGLVTDYTSMVVVRDDVFDKYNIQRTNAKRVEREHDARQRRASASVRDNRRDTQEPMYKNARPSMGGGATGPWFLILLLPLLATVGRKQKA